MSKRALITGMDPIDYRPADVVDLVGDASRAKEELGWEPRTYFAELVRIMVDADVQNLDQLGPR